MDTMIGFAADATNNITSKKLFVAKLFKDDNPYLIILSFTCTVFIICMFETTLIYRNACQEYIQLY